MALGQALGQGEVRQRSIPALAQGLQSTITTTIDRDQRDGLYELVRNHLGSIEDFWVALERTNEFAKAEALSLEFAETSGCCKASAGASTTSARRSI
jgi:hypothetical protein